VRTASERRLPSGALDAERVRADFPALHQQVHGKPLVYLDNAATTHKPRVVIDALAHYYEADNSNVHRGVHALSERATAAYEQARDTVRGFLNAAQREEIVFTRGKRSSGWCRSMTPAKSSTPSSSACCRRAPGCWALCMSPTRSAA
jgi:hypothetical protein